jgi:hypothetical protein
MNHSTCILVYHDSQRASSWVYGPEIGDMDESVVEGCEDAGNTKHKFTWRGKLLVTNSWGEGD